MIQFKLNKEWIPILDDNSSKIFSIIDIDMNNVFNYENDVKWLIECFHKRYEWDGFPNWETIISRLETGKNIFFLCQYNNKIIGWCWWRIGEVDINKEYIKFYCKTNNTTVWGYNNFLVSNKIIKKPENSGTLWMQLMFKKLIEMGMVNILADVESWQTPAIEMCTNSGMKQIDWITNIIENA